VPFVLIPTARCKEDLSVGGRKELIGRDILLAAVIGFLITWGSVNAVGQEQVLHAFNGADGIRPDAGVILDGSGNVYGTTSGGGGSRCDCGTVFKLSLGTNGKWTRTVLHRFNGKDGANPFAGVISDAAGNLYGTTWLGGNSQNPCDSNCGVVFKLSPGANGAWTETVLHEFNGKDGAEPYAGLIFDAAGNLYGATSVGGTSSCCGFGTVFKLSPGANGKWTETVLHSFNGKDGANPYAGVIFDGAGNLYGTTFSAATGKSTVFRLTPSANGKWTHTVLHPFSGKDGRSLYAGLIFDAEGNLYGATEDGGAYNGGTVFKLSPGANGKWTHTVLLHAFNGADGAQPYAGLVFDAAWNLYGTTFEGGTSKSCIGCGTVFKLSPQANGKWSETVLYSFNGYDGQGPLLGSLNFDTSGRLYGTTTAGGNSSACDSHGCGVVFKIAP
jgi:uncharacterized repeat protein (TIGR03803 family)